MKRLSILGSTGSIGTQTLDVVRKNKQRFKVFALSANQNIDCLMRQIEEFSPEIVCVVDEAKADILSDKVRIDVEKGEKGLIRAAVASDVDTVVTSVVGNVGLQPTIKAILAGKTIALANKETLVAAGEIVMTMARKMGVPVIPIDSEHCAIHQCIGGVSMDRISRLIITASGGSFRDKSFAELLNVTISDALNHPTWSMGKKITIDSATLMNKGFEVIEAKHLFGLPLEKIETIMHPQSIVHSMVEFIDKNIIAQLGSADMRIPICYALNYPDRIDLDVPKFDFVGQKLEFREIDKGRFSALAYAYEACRIGGTMPAVLNSANDVAVLAFLDEKISFLDITRLVRDAMDTHKIIMTPDLDDIFATCKKTKEIVEKQILSMQP
ncbi:1-deoxy-D-xylulose-5-phosphate reductoisomerase [Candidatus Woesearchaeota archaeon CG11_big_fil_rev_8_21_14_0_20_43_8]|nr:MAG: 1-deoxy-D-xylulose-5-phosphate reductoisomerase [Candidatus Woesearchaeota archaeon CG11_big_fil_rev_8_21_14_0_20_43_8]PIO04701.1 MAG: 1-deoxy-D-xylulose-5-phosphate reductoisomerase [Candidatus Woesearchaeota archaeon CG08_land_8_20_14_0_20_43_7]